MVSTRRRKRLASLKPDEMKKVKSPRPMKGRPKNAKPHVTHLATKNRGKVAKKRVVLNSSNAARSFAKKHKAIKSIGTTTPKRSTKAATPLANGVTPTNTQKRGTFKPSTSQVSPKPLSFAVTPQSSFSTGQTPGKSTRVVFNKEKLQRLLHRVAQSPNFGNTSKSVQIGTGNQSSGSVTRAAAIVAPTNRFSLNESQQPPATFNKITSRPVQVTSQAAPGVLTKISPIQPNSQILKRKSARCKSKKSSPVSSSLKQVALSINGDSVRDKKVKQSSPIGLPISKEQMLQGLNLFRSRKAKIQADVTVKAGSTQNISVPVTSTPAVEVQLSASALKEKIKARLNATSNWNLTPITSPVPGVKKPTLASVSPSAVAVNSQLLKKKLAERLKVVHADKHTASPASVKFVGLINGTSTSQIAPAIASSSTQPFDLIISKPVSIGQNQPKSSRVLRWRERSLSRGLSKKSGSDIPTSPKKAPPPPLMTRIDIDVPTTKPDATFTASRPMPKKATGQIKPVLNPAALRQKLQARLTTAAGAVKPNVTVAPDVTVSPVATTSLGHGAHFLGTLQHPIKPTNLRAKMMEKLSFKSPTQQNRQMDGGNLFNAFNQTPTTTNATSNSVVKETCLRAKTKKDVAATTTQQTRRSATSTMEGKSSSQPAVKSLGERMIERLKGARFRHINENLYTISGTDAVKFFSDDPEAFQEYHEGYQSQMCKWPLHPLDLIIKNIRRMPETVVIADFGCGDARLARSVPHKVHSFDLIALNKHVVACNMEKVPLPNESVNMVVFCLSLMGTSLTAYLKEANRILKMGGLLKIAEIESRFTVIARFVGQLRDLGFSLLSKNMNHKMFIMINCVKVGNCSPNVKTNVVLKPCLYKRR